MEIDVELEKLNNEILRKIGRNVILFQQVEHTLKHILIYQNLSVYKSDDGIKSDLEERKAAFSKQCMGLVAGKYIENTFSLSETVSDEAAQGVMSFKVKHDPIICDSEFYNQRKEEMAEIVAQRNELIHHLLPKWNSKSYESGQAIDQYLDAQRDKVKPEIEVLKSIAEAREEAGKEMAEFLLSEAGHKYFMLDGLRSTFHVWRLFEFAATKMRSDGWAIIGSAAHFIRQSVSENILMEELVAIKKGYGCKTLKEIIQKSEYFDIREESTQKGGVRMLYKIKPGFELRDGSIQHEIDF